MIPKLNTEKLTHLCYLNYKTSFSLIFMQDSGINNIGDSPLFFFC